MRTAGKTNLEPRLSLFFGPDCSSGFHSGKDNRKRDKINPKIASDWIGGSAVRRLQRGCTCADRADGTGWVGLTLLYKPAALQRLQCRYGAASYSRSNTPSQMRPSVWDRLAFSPVSARPSQRERDCFQGYGDIRIIWFPCQWPPGEQGKGLCIWLHMDFICFNNSLIK